MTIEVRKETKVEKWVREHKKELAIAGAIIGSFALGMLYEQCTNKKLKKLHEAEKELEGYKLSDPDECTKRIDEDIFTNLAPTIEDAVLSGGIDEFYMDRDYPVEFESGDTRLRRVSVSVKDMGMYEE